MIINLKNNNIMSFKSSERRVNKNNLVGENPDGDYEL